MTRDQSDQALQEKSVNDANRAGVLARFGTFLSTHILELMISLLVLYAILPFVSPIAFKLGFNGVGEGIQNIYHVFCHQRVERSIFLFGEDALIAFYTVQELKDDDDIPQYNLDAPIPIWTTTYFGYPYWGNEKIGYKVAFCLRDVGLYWSLAITSIIAYWWIKKNNRNINVSWKYLVLLMIPMAVDGTFQTIVEAFGVPGLSQQFITSYIANMPKRIITGGLFGIGFGLFMVKNLYKATSLLKEENEDAPNKVSDPK